MWNSDETMQKQGVDTYGMETGHKGTTEGTGVGSMDYVDCLLMEQDEKCL